MPYEWYEPEIYVKLEDGTAICHCYRYGNILQCLYQFKDDKSESGWSAFDVRELSKQAPWFIDKSAGHAEQILQASIKAEDAGISLRDWLLAYEVNLFSYWEEE